MVSTLWLLTIPAQLTFRLRKYLLILMKFWNNILIRRKAYNRLSLKLICRILDKYKLQIIKTGEPDIMF